jgi:glycosyltransferase involved in cell wall biosynthesis
MRERRSVSLIRKWGIEPGNYALFLGRFSPEKNCHLLIEAFERLDSAAQLVMAGGSLPSDPYAKQLYRHCNDRIRLMNYVSGEAFEEMLTNAMLFVLPSDIEGLSLALLEAMGAGLCVLASDIPENRELVDGAGFTFKKGDVADLERMLHLLINDPEARKEAGRRAKRRIQEEYLWEKIAAQVEQVYINLYGWKQGPRARSHDLVTLLSERGNAAWRESA